MATDNQKYEAGYSHGYHDVARDMEFFLDDDYEMGYADGSADRVAGAEPRGVKSAFIGNNFEENNEPPEGYRWLGEFRTPLKGEIYLTKAGNAGVAKSDPKNGRQRHMLEAISRCNDGYRYHRWPGIPCEFAEGHTGKCSSQLIK